MTPKRGIDHRVGKAYLHDMRRRTSTLLAVLAMVVTLTSGIPRGAAAMGGASVRSPAERIPGEALVRFRPGTSPERRASIDRMIGGMLERRLLLPRTELVHVGRGQTVQELIARYQRLPEVVYAEPNSIATVAAVPNDPFLSKEWALQNVGQKVNGVTGTSGSDIDVMPAWDSTVGSSAVTVGVADTGIDIADPDLASNSVSGWNFVNGNNDASDDVWHGTFVAGIIGAVGNDGYGVSGVNWRVGIASLKACSLVAVSKNTPPAICTAANQANAFTYAGMMGMPVVNASFNGGTYSKTVYNAIASAPNTLFVTVPGNSAKNVDVAHQYPCGYALANIICVAATDQNDNLATFSSYGPSTVDLAAPGVNIYSTHPFVSRFSDNFTKDLTGRWIAGGVNSTWARLCTSQTACVLADSPNGNYSNSEDTWIQTAQPLNLSQWTACQVQYILKGVVASGDSLVVSASTDSVTWAPLASWSGSVSNWPQATYDMPGFDGASAVYLRFELVSDSTGTADGVSIDNAAIVCQPAPGTYRGTSAEYAFSKGTSFAAAYVSGAAALLKAYNPSATTDQIRAALLNGVHPVPSLVGKVVTGGRLDVSNSLGSLGHG
jgi:subtilisin family serine protease